MRTRSVNGTVLWLCACNFLAVAVCADDSVKTLGQFRRDAVNNQDAQPPSKGADSNLELNVGAAPRPTSCPTAVALDDLKHEIAYDRTEELDPLEGLSVIHMHVLERGSLTAFYLDESLRTFPPNIRLAYFVGADGARGYSSCRTEQNWQKCVEESARLEEANYLVQTCSTTVDLSTIPVWEPSPNSPKKRQVADELRREIETKWPGALEIVVRDFNLKDRQITMYLRMPDADYFQGCGFHAMRETVCESWHLFGMAPVADIRRRIFNLPYRLK
jgi:hypothetical protein